MSVVLIANKCDLENKTVTSADGKRLAETYNIPFFEVSAMTGENVKIAFETLSANILAKVKANPPTKEESLIENKKLTAATATATEPSKKKQ